LNHLGIAMVSGICWDWGDASVMIMGLYGLQRVSVSVMLREVWDNCPWIYWLWKVMPATVFLADKLGVIV
jgi:hypothetical protein